MMVFMPLVVVWIGQFCRDVIGHQNMKVAVIGRLLFYCKTLDSEADYRSGSQNISHQQQSF